MNRISVFYAHICEAAQQREKSIEDTLYAACGFGITALECDIQQLEDMPAVRRLFESCAMEVSSVYGSFDFPHDSIAVSHKKIDRFLEKAAEFNADKVLCIPGFFHESDDKKSVFPRVCELISFMCDRAEQYDITVTVEDYDDISSPCCTSKQLLSLVKCCPKLRLTFDTGNFLYCGEDALSLYDILSPYVVHIHCKDRLYSAACPAEERSVKQAVNGDLLYPSPCCEGVVKLPQILRKALGSGYKGTFAIEHFGAADQLAYMERSAQAILNRL